MSWLSRYGRCWRSSRRHFKRWFISRRDGPLRPTDCPTDCDTSSPRRITLCLLTCLPFPFAASILSRSSPPSLPPSPLRRFHSRCRRSARPVRVVHFRLLDFAASLSGNGQYGGVAGGLLLLPRPNETRAASERHHSAVDETQRCLLQSPTAYRLSTQLGAAR